MLIQALLIASTAAFVVVGATVGLRLLLLALRSRQIPDLTVGVALLAIAGVAYPLLLVCRVPGVLAPHAHAVTFSIAMVVAAIGYASVYVFTWRVFRPHSRWAIALVASGSLVLIVQAWGSIAAIVTIPEPDLVADLTRDWTLVRRCAAVVVFGWSGTESLLYYMRMRRRLALGLADSLVTRRFLLWAIASSGAATGSGVNAVIALGDTGAFGHPVSLAAIAVSGFVSAVALWLAFLPSPRARGIFGPARRRSGS